MEGRGPVLRQYTPGSGAIPPAQSGRNPFRFAHRSASAAGNGEPLPPLPPPDGLPELPLPLAQPPLRLLGVVTEADGGRVAVISVGGDLVLARVGDRVAGRFSVTTIGEETVELTDTLAPDAPVQLALP